jgi:hypothetical protein
MRTDSVKFIVTMDWGSKISTAEQEEPVATAATGPYMWT